MAANWTTRAWVKRAVTRRSRRMREVYLTTKLMVYGSAKKFRWHINAIRRRFGKRAIPDNKALVSWSSDAGPHARAPRISPAAKCPAASRTICRVHQRAYIAPKSEPRTRAIPRAGSS